MAWSRTPTWKVMDMTATRTSRPDTMNHLPLAIRSGALGSIVTTATRIRSRGRRNFLAGPSFPCDRQTSAWTIATVASIRLDRSATERIRTAGVGARFAFFVVVTATYGHRSAGTRSSIAICWPTLIFAMSRSRAHSIKRHKDRRVSRALSSRSAASFNRPAASSRSFDNSALSPWAAILAASTASPADR
jgi:hypothetical protein